MLLVLSTFPSRPISLIVSAKNTLVTLRNKRNIKTLQNYIAVYCAYGLDYPRNIKSKFVKINETSLYFFIIFYLELGAEEDIWTQEE
jgi:hypothetical protein